MGISELKYNVPVEITEKQYNAIQERKNRLNGAIAHRKEEGRYFIKLMLVSHRYQALHVLEQNA